MPLASAAASSSSTPRTTTHHRPPFCRAIAHGTPGFCPSSTSRISAWPTSGQCCVTCCLRRSEGAWCAASAHAAAILAARAASKHSGILCLSHGSKLHVCFPSSPPQACFNRGCSFAPLYPQVLYQLLIQYLFSKFSLLPSCTPSLCRVLPADIALPPFFSNAPSSRDGHPATAAVTGARMIALHASFAK